MNEIHGLSDRIRELLDAKNLARERALERSRTLVRHCALAIRAVHRGERPLALAQLGEARTQAQALREELGAYPDLYFAGYCQDSLKEFAEASIVSALVAGERLPAPEEIGVEPAPYLNGLGEAAGELRRRCLDVIRLGNAEEAERLLGLMDEIYALLVTLDYPDALTGNLRRTTDMVRGVTERTRGDLTLSLRLEDTQRALGALQAKLGDPEAGPQPKP
ncbi:MAG: haloacid dehalogenase [Anaerolineales bacterium]|jgi:translin